METSVQFRIIETGNAAIEIAVRGEDGRLVVMVPGLGRGLSDFDELAAALAEAGWRAVSMNPRGAGRSRGRLDNLTMHDLATDLAGVIENLHGAPAAVIGHAFGNRVARCLASGRPELVSCLVLLAAGGKIAPGPEFQEAVKRSRAKDATPDQRREALREAYFARGSDSSCWLTGNWAEAVRAQSAAGQATPLKDWWSGGDSPILVIQGQEDRCAPPANGHLLRQECGGRVEVRDIPGAAHALLSEQPAAIAEAVINFLKTRHPAGI